MNFETFEEPPLDQKQVSRFSVFKGEMVKKKKTATKSKFSQHNDKGFYFPRGIGFSSFGHPNLKEIDQFKQEKG